MPYVERAREAMEKNRKLRELLVVNLELAAQNLGEGFRKRGETLREIERARNELRPEAETAP